MRKIYSILLLAVAMLCLGATNAKADQDLSAHFYLIGNMTGDNWTSNKTDYAINKTYQSTTGKYYIEVSVTPGTEYYFALYNGEKQYGPSTNGIAPNTVGGYDTTNSWKYTPTSSKIWICVDETSTSVYNSGWYPWVWVEEKLSWTISSGGKTLVNLSKDDQISLNFTYGDNTYPINLDGVSLCNTSNSITVNSESTSSAYTVPADGYYLLDVTSIGMKTSLDTQTFLSATINLTIHALTHFDAVESTYTTQGNSENYHCATCDGDGTYYVMDEGNLNSCGKDYVTLSKTSLSTGDNTLGALSAKGNVSCEFTPEADGIYSFTANNATVSVSAADNDYENYASGVGSCALQCTAGTTYTIMCANSSESGITGLSLNISTVSFKELVVGNNTGITFGSYANSTFTIPAEGSGDYKFVLTQDGAAVTNVTFYVSPTFSINSNTAARSNNGVALLPSANAGDTYYVKFYTQEDLSGAVLSISKIIIKDQAVYNSENKSITFYSDESDHSSEGIVYKITEYPTESYPDWWYDIYENLTTATFAESFANARPTSLRGWFYNCKNLTTVTGFENVNVSELTNMNSLFEYCEALTSVTLPSGLTFIGNEVFDGCKALLSITIPSGVTSIGESAFRDCDALTSITLPSSLQSIGGQAFSDCDKLTGTISIPASVQTIGSYAFFGSINLTEIQLHSIPAMVEDAYLNVASTRTLTLDDNSYIYTGNDNVFPTLTSAPTYTRSMTNNWGTVVLPFATKSNDDVQLYTLTAVTTGEDGAMTFTTNDESVLANTPCVFKKNSSATSVTFTAENTAVSVAAEPSASTGVVNWTMKGTYENVTGKTGVYFIAQNKFWYADDAISIAPFRAWFTSTSGAKSFNIVVDDEADGISLTPAISQGEGVSKYLENGKVVIVRNGKKFNINGQEIK